MAQRLTKDAKRNMVLHCQGEASRRMGHTFGLRGCRISPYTDECTYVLRPCQCGFDEANNNRLAPQHAWTRQRMCQAVFRKCCSLELDCMNSQFRAWHAAFFQSPSRMLMRDTLTEPQRARKDNESSQGPEKNMVVLTLRHDRELQRLC